MIVLKIGGAVITDKSPDSVNVAKFEMIEKIAKKIAENLKDKLILVHGVGSFGHPHVVKYGLLKKKNVKGVTITHLSCVSLNMIVCGYLSQYGLNPIPIHPLSTFRLIGGRLIFPENIEKLVDDGMIPVIHGDMVFSDGGFEVLSGDRIAVEIAKALKVSRVGFATDVEGVIVDGKVMEEIESAESVGLAEGKEDVTGGMRGKVEMILRGGINAYVFHYEDIDKFLKGERVGTLVRGVEHVR